MQKKAEHFLHDLFRRSKAEQALAFFPSLFKRLTAGGARQGMRGILETPSPTFRHLKTTFQKYRITITITL